MTDLAHDPAALREDRLLGGRVRMLQPLAGYRAATDPVLLAAACPARPGQSVLDLGCGAGAVALCLAARVPELRLTGLEIQPAYAALARQNAALNAVAMTVIEGDVAHPPADLRALSCDHVVMNPPFHDAGAVQPLPRRERDLAHREGAAGPADWVGCAIARLRPGGMLTVVHRTERLPDLLAALGGRAGAVAVLPLAARAGRAARRVVLRAVKGARGPFRLCAPLILHDGPEHLADRDDFTAEASAILRQCAPLAF